MKLFVRSFILCVCIILLHTLAGGASIYNAGFRTVGVWNQDTRIRFDLNIWYPTFRPAQEINLSRWYLSGAHNAKPAEGKFPLIIISHASPGNRFSYNYLSSWFTRLGYIVLSPTHPHDNMENMEDLFTWKQIKNRIDEIVSALDLIFSDKTFSKLIDKTAIGYIGFGAGATAGLILAGAKPDCARWPAYCGMAGYRDVYCTPWAVEKINALCGYFPLSQPLEDRRIKAFALIAPAYGMLFSDSSFKNFNAPVILVGAGRDTFNRVDLHCEPIARLLGKRSSYLDLPDADTGALMGACNYQLAAELPELCQSISKEERQKIHVRLQNTLQTFFERYLSGKAE